MSGRRIGWSGITGSKEIQYYDYKYLAPSYLIARSTKEKFNLFAEKLDESMC